MADNGVQSTNLSRATTVQSLVGNSDGSTVRQEIGDLAIQLVATSGVAAELSAIRSEQVAGDVALEAKITSNNLGATKATPAETIAGENDTHWTSPAANKAAVDARIDNLRAIRMPPESGYIWAIVDSAGHACFKISIDGTVTGKISIADGSLSYGKLDSSITPLLAKAMPSESGYSYVIVDSAGYVAFAIKNDGAIAMKVSSLTGKAVTASNLSDDLARAVLPRTADVVPCLPDRWRAQLGQIALKIVLIDGGWARIPPRPARLMFGPNASGADIQVRKSSGLLFVGESYGGTFDPGTKPSSNYKGNLLGPSIGTPSGTFSAGDYYLYSNGSGTTSTGTFAGMKVGDALVYDGASWSIQAAPGTFGSRNANAWWIVSAAGTFDGLSLGVGDRVIYLGRQTGGGGAQFERWYKADAANDLVYRGEFTPSSGLPSSPADGEVYQASAAGSAGGFTWALGDYAVRWGGAWTQIVNDVPVTVASGQSFTLRCVADASEWEMRRADKSPSGVGVRLNAQLQSMQVPPRDFIWLLSDSMFGVSGVGATVLSLTGRNGTVSSYGGATSDQVRAMMDYEITRGGDAYSGALLVAWHGQNNQPSIEANAALIRETSLRMAQLLGSRDRRHLFLSVLGQRSFAWNGTRLVCSQHEDQFARTGYLYELERWYERAFKGQWLSPRKALLAAASSTPDPQFPGMTEAQVAATYGIVPLSFFNGSLPVAAASLVYKGTWTDTMLPTGGTANDYYIRVGGTGTVGALLINVAGTWTEWTWDLTHLSPTGANALAAAIVAAINANGW